EVAREHPRTPIAQMSVRARDARLDNRRVRTRAQHCFVVIRLEHENVQPLESGAIRRRYVTEIVHYPRAHSARARGGEHRNRLGAIVRRAHRLQPEIAELQRVARGKRPGARLAQQRISGDRAAARVHRPLPSLRRRAHSAHVVRVLVRHDRALDRLAAHADRGESRRELAHRESRIDEDARVSTLHEHRVPRAPAPQHPHAHGYPLRLLACDALSWRRARSLNATERRDITRSAISRNLGKRNSSSAAPSPHENGGTYLGGICAPNTLAPAPITLPVVRRLPMPVLAWSPMSEPIRSEEHT